MTQIDSFNVHYESYGMASMKEFNWKGVDLNLLVAFQALYQSRSVSLAAQCCFVSQSAMSHTLQRMRVLFDDPLFERVGAKMEPTVRANELSPIVDTLLSSIKEDLLTRKQFSAQDYKGICKIGLTDYAEQLFASVLFDEIKRQAPHAQISFYNVNRGNYHEMVDKEQIDVVIGSIDSLNRRFSSERLYTEQHLCLFDPEVVRFSEPVSLTEFISIEHALVSPDGSLQTKVDKELAKYGYERRVGAASRNFLTVRRLLIGRELVCIVPKRFAEMEMYNHALKAVTPPVEVSDFDINLIYLKAFQHEEKNRWLRNVVLRVVK